MDGQTDMGHTVDSWLCQLPKTNSGCWRATSPTEKVCYICCFLPKIITIVWGNFYPKDSDGDYDEDISARDFVDDYQVSVISCRRLCRWLSVVSYQLPETVAIVDNYVAKGYEDTNEDEDLFLNDGGDGAGELTKVGN